GAVDVYVLDDQAAVVRRQVVRLREVGAHRLDGDAEFFGAGAFRGLGAGVGGVGDLVVVLGGHELDGEGLLVTEAHHVERDGRTRLVHPDHALQGADAVDWLAVGADDDIAGLEAGFLGRTRAVGGLEALHDGDADCLEARGAGIFGADRGDRDADYGAADFAVLDDFVHHALGERDWDREAIARVVAGRARDRAVDADHVAVSVDERTARVTGVDRRVGLQEVGDRVLGRQEATEVATIAALCAQDTRGDGLAEAERVADGQDPLADLGVVVVAQVHDGKIVRLDLDDRNVGRRIAADDLGLEDALVIERHRDAVGVGDDVIV